MNENLQNTVNEVLLNLIGGVTQAKDFILGELPDVVQQLLAWKMWESLIYFVASWIFVLLMIWYWRWVYKSWDRLYKIDWEEPAVGAGIIVSLICAAVFAFGAVTNWDWLQIMIAPKVYLLEYAASLVR